MNERIPYLPSSALGCRPAVSYKSHPDGLLLITDQLAEGILIDLVKYFAELFVLAAPGGKVMAVLLPQRADQGVAVLAANLRSYRGVSGAIPAVPLISPALNLLMRLIHSSSRPFCHHF
jgi:hypothetical protein